MCEAENVWHRLGCKLIVGDVAQPLVPSVSLNTFLRVRKVVEDSAFLLALCPVGPAYHLLNLARTEVAVERKHADEGRNRKLQVKAARELFLQEEQATFLRGGVDGSFLCLVCISDVKKARPMQVCSFFQAI